MNIFPWNIIPMIKLIIPFIAGIIVSIHLQFPIEQLLVLSISLLFLIITSFQLNAMWQFKLRYLTGAVVLLGIFTSSIFLTSTFVQINKDYHFSHSIGRDAKIIGKIIELPEERAKTFKVVVKVSSYIEDGQIHHQKGKVLIYLRKDSLSDKLTFGDAIIFINKMREVEARGNPGQFDFKRFLSYKQIYHQAFLGTDDWVPLDQNHASFIFREIVKIRVRIIELLEENIRGKDERSIAKALIAGYKTELSPLVRQSFASTGAMHVLAVSGLHVGILFLVFSSILKFLKRYKNGRFIFLIVNLAVLWFYAIMTGLSPSVLRASAMFSFVLIGQSMKRSTNIYSSIYTSAFTILLFNPFLITQVGFQLSYAAVLGIITFQPRIYGLVNTKKQLWIIDKAWALTAVSLSAQLATFPLGLMYFTQFPVYFLVSNLIVIPAATFIMYSGFSFLILEMSGIKFLSFIMAKILDLLVTGLNKSVLIINDFPHGLIEEVYISAPMTLILYAFIISGFLLIIHRKKTYLLSTLLCLLLFVSGYFYWRYDFLTSREAVIYSVKGHSLMGFYDGRKIVFYGDEKILNDFETLKYNTFRDIWRHGQKAKRVEYVKYNDNYESANIMIENNLISFYDHIFIVVDKGLDVRSLEKIDKDVYLILKDDVFFNFSNESLSGFRLIFDGSNSFGKRKLWKRLAEHNAQWHLDIIDKGACKLDLKKGRLDIIRNNQ